MAAIDGPDAGSVGNHRTQNGLCICRGENQSGCQASTKSQFGEIEGEKGESGGGVIKSIDRTVPINLRRSIDYIIYPLSTIRSI
jgi:hypothetical protein